jgi:hypothetical protein
MSYCICKTGEGQFCFDKVLAKEVNFNEVSRQYGTIKVTESTTTYQKIAEESVSICSACIKLTRQQDRKTGTLIIIFSLLLTAVPIINTIISEPQWLKIAGIIIAILCFLSIIIGIAIFVGTYQKPDHEYAHFLADSWMYKHFAASKLEHSIFSLQTWNKMKNKN